MDIQDIDVARLALQNGAVFVPVGRSIGLLLPAGSVRCTAAGTLPARAPARAANDNGDRFGPGAAR